jgi:hypothetical protein
MAKQDDNKKAKKAADELLNAVGKKLKNLLEQTDGSKVLSVSQEMAAIAQSLAWIKLVDQRSAGWGRNFGSEDSLAAGQEEIGTEGLESGEVEDIFAEEEDDEPGSDLDSAEDSGQRMA